MAEESPWNAALELLDKLPVGVLRTDSVGRCLAMNPRAMEVLGLSAGAAAGEGWLRDLDGSSRQLLSELLNRSGSALGTRSANLSLKGAGGEGRVLSCRAVPLSLRDGVPAEFLITLLDVTHWQRGEEDRKRTTRELAFKVRELDCLFEISRAVERSAGNLDAILHETVQILARTWGYRGPSCARIVLDGQSFETENFMPCPQTRRVPIFVHGQEVGELQVGQTGSRTSEERPLSSGEEERLLTTVAQRLGRTTERVRGRRLLREKEQEMRERLTHLTRVSTMGEMASSIAHEVNQPLAAIATYAQACRRLMEHPDPDLSEISDVLGRINSEALRAGNIVHRLKDLVRRQETRWTECDLNRLVQDVEQLASADARLHDVELSFHLASKLPPILADGVQLQQVILNLIRNGIDAVEEAGRSRGKVTVRTSRAGPRKVALSVEDNGAGLSDGAEEQLFQPFFTTKKGGMGMGLSISKSIAANHKGTITFERNPEQGMTFTLTVPILDDL